MEPNIKTWRIHRGLSWLFALLTLMLLSLPLMTLMSDEKHTDPTFAQMLAFPAGTFLIFLMHHFVGRGARERRSWARVASMCIAGVMLFAFPLGTIIGVYLFANSRWSPATPQDGPVAAT